MSRACRPRRRARPSPTSPRRTRPPWRGCAAPAPSSSARPISISSRPAWSACARPTASRATRFNPALIPGGSSSGSAVAVAAGLVPLALGTDTAGSGRVPAGLNNIVGLKPSLGLVSTAGVVPACRSLDCVSVFALTIDDAWTALAAIAGPDAADPYSRARPLGALGAFRRRRAARRADRRASACSSATRSRPAPTTRRSRARPRSARRSSRSTSSRSTRPRGCSTKGRGWRSATSSLQVAAGVVAGRRSIRSPGRSSSRARGRAPSIRSPPSTSSRSCAASRDARVPDDRRAAAADRADGLHRRAGAGRSDPAQQPARHLHQLRQPARSLRPRGAGLDAAGRHAVRHHAARAGRTRCAARLDRPRLPRRHRAAARRARHCRSRRCAAMRPRRRPTRSPSRWSARICPACRSTAN